MTIIHKIFKKKEKIISNYSEINYDSYITQFSTNLNKRLRNSDIIYVESSYHPEINKFIVTNLDKVKKHYEDEGKTFVYLPFKLKELIRYNYPYISSDILTDEELTKYTQKMYKSLYFLTNQATSKTEFYGLVRYTEDTNHYEQLEYQPFPYFRLFSPPEMKYSDGNTIFNSISFCVDKPWKERYRGGEGYFADDYFNEESKQLILEVWNKIEKLEEMGISFNVLQKLISVEKTRNLSRIIITSDYKIFLPEFNNIEIIMSPLPKAVFLLFLKHPEGIFFKNLHDYKSELKQIYQQISSREDYAKSKRSINDLTDPTSNSINEKCSRIREAFVRHFDDDIAKYYYVTGDRAMPKKILISRSLVEWR